MSLGYISQLASHTQGSLCRGLPKGSLRGLGPDPPRGSADFSWEPSLKGAKTVELSAKLTSLNKSCNFPESLCLKVQKPWSLRPIGPKSWEPSPKTSTPGPESCHFPRSLRPIGPKSWEPVLATRGPGLETAEIVLPGAHFGHFWCQGQQILKLGLRGLIFNDFWGQG